MKELNTKSCFNRTTNDILNAADRPCLQLLQESNKRSGPNFENYLVAHAFLAPDEENAMFSALMMQGVARLESALVDARRELSVMFSEAEFMLMLHCYRNVFLTPEDLEHMVVAVCAFLGIDPATHEQSDHADFISRIELMTSYHRAALAGALEVAWLAGSGPLSAVARLGIVFQ